MVDTNVQKYTDLGSINVVDALKKINSNAKGIMFVVDDKGALVGCVTDGDVRRWLIKTGDLNAPISSFMNEKPKYLYDKEKKKAAAVMEEWTVTAVPILNPDKTILQVVLRDNPEDYDKYNDALKDTPVVIMAGGQGTRLYPYTKILPKPLIPIGDIPIAERIIHQFTAFGCHEFHLIVNHKKNMIKAYFNEIEKDYEVYYADEDIPLGTGGGLSLLKGRIDSTFILSNCDILVREDFEKIVRTHKEQANEITMVCSLKNYPIPYGVVHLGEEGQLADIEEKPQMSFLTNTGVYIIEPGVIDRIADNTAMGFPDIIEENKAAGKRIGIYPVSEQSWLDMGQMNTLEEMMQQIEETIGA